MGGVQREGLHWEDLAAMIQKEFGPDFREPVQRVAKLLSVDATLVYDREIEAAAESLESALDVAARHPGMGA